MFVPSDPSFKVHILMHLHIHWDLTPLNSHSEQLVVILLVSPWDHAVMSLIYLCVLVYIHDCAHENVVLGINMRSVEPRAL